MQAERQEIFSELKALREESRQFKAMMDEKKKEMEPLQQALGKLRYSNSGARSGGLCSSEEELNEVVRSNYISTIKFKPVNLTGDFLC